METIYLLLGSNQGNCLDNLNQARKAIGQLGKIEVVSALYQTKAWGNQHQPDFLNQIVVLSSSLPAVEMLGKLKQIERELGRKLAEKWGPRTIDIDIILYGDQVLETEGLTIPHPKMHERRFVLVPLAEVAPRVYHPILKKSALELLAECPDNLGIEKLN